MLFRSYEIVSRNNIASINDLGQKVNGVSIVAFKNNQLLLLKEFRMGVNQVIYNLCAGMIEEDEDITACIHRELYEETGLHVVKILDILPPSFAAVGISDTKTRIAIVEVDGIIEGHFSENEDINAAFYTKEECKKMLYEEEFSSRSQIITYFFTKNMFDKLDN